MVNENTPKQMPSHARQAPYGEDQASIFATILERNYVRYNDQNELGDAAPADALDSAGYN